MPRQKGFRLVEVVTLLTEVTTMLATAIRKAGGPPIDQNQFFSDLQDLVKRYGTSAPEPVLATAEEPPQEEEFGKPDYNLAADLMAGAVLNQQVGNTQEAWSGFKAACAAVGIDQVLEAFEAYNNQAMSDLGSDPTVTDNVHTENGDLDNGEMDTPPSDLPPTSDLGLDEEDDEDDDGEDRLAVQDDQTTDVQKFMNMRKSRAKPHAETVALANKISQSGSKRSLKMVRANFV